LTSVLQSPVVKVGLATQMKICPTSTTGAKQNTIMPKAVKFSLRGKPLIFLLNIVLLYYMKKDIHPKYYPNAQVKCACGNTFTVGSTKEFIEVEICSRCHPFYTGRERIIDTMGQVQKFRKRLAKKEELAKKRKK